MRNDRPPPPRHNGTFHQTGEQDLAALSEYYHLPRLSLRSVVHHAGVADAVPLRAGDWLTKGAIHPNDVGHSYIADLVIRYLYRVLDDAARRPLTRDDRAFLAMPLPRSMLPVRGGLWWRCCFRHGGECLLRGGL